jgi:hypothetical protein
MIIDVRGKVIHPVGKMNDLGIGVLFTHLFNPTVDIATVWLKRFHDFTLEGDNQPEHTMSGRVLRTHINVVFLFPDIRDGCMDDFFHV